MKLVIGKPTDTKEKELFLWLEEDSAGCLLLKSMHQQERGFERTELKIFPGGQVKLAFGHTLVFITD